MKSFPCAMCETKKVGCHSSCEKYAEEKAIREEWRKNNAKNNDTKYYMKKTSEKLWFSKKRWK